MSGWKDPLEKEMATHSRGSFQPDIEPMSGWKDPLEKEMATHSTILAWEIPWTEESGGLQPMGLQKVGHQLVTQQQQMYVS